MSLSLLISHDKANQSQHGENHNILQHYQNHFDPTIYITNCRYINNHSRRGKHFEIVDKIVKLEYKSCDFGGDEHISLDIYFSLFVKILKYPVP